LPGGTRAATLTPEPARRAQRLLAAARAKRDVGAMEAALRLLASVEAGPRDAMRAAEVEYLRGGIAMEQRRSRDATRLLLSAARRFEPLTPGLARETYLEALTAAIWADDLDSPGGLRETAEAARAAPPGPDPPRAVDVLVDAFATWLTDGYATAAPVLIRALELVLAASADADREAAHWLWLAGGRVSQLAAAELWDDEAWHTLGAHQVQATRDAGALVQLQFVLNFLAMPHLLAGELSTAAQLVEEDRLIAETTGNPPIAYTAMALAAWRGQEAPASALIEATVQEATARGQGRLVTFANYARSVLGNGLGRHEAARDAAWRAFERDPLGYGPFIVPELAEAAARTGRASRGGRASTGREAQVDPQLPAGGRIGHAWPFWRWLSMSKARHTSLMWTTPRRPVSSMTSRCWKRLLVMILAASRMLVAGVMTVG
jgi:hypothetical protein